MKTLREYLDQLDEISRRDFLKGAGAAAGIYAVNKISKNDDEAGCPEYVSKFSCDYVENKAPFDVLLWVPTYIAKALGIHGFNTGEGYIEANVGGVIGVRSVKQKAISKYRQIVSMADQKFDNWDQSKYPWSDRLYIGMLKGPNGENLEKHRYLGITKN